jgi:predicted MFS family arabinose efflux permease
MGRFSSYGSLGWIAGALAGALLKDFNTIFIFGAFCCAAAAALSLLFPHQAGQFSKRQKVKKINFGSVFRKGLPVYLAVFMRHLGAVSVWIILPLYFTSQGLDRFWVGVLWGTNFTVQFIVMRYLQRFNPALVFTLGQLLSTAVFVAYVFTHNLVPLLAVQALLGVGWSCLYVGALLLVLRIGEDIGTASGIFQATLNLCHAAGPFLGGLISQGWGYSGTMIFAAILGAVGLAVSVPKTRTAGQTNA